MSICPPPARTRSSAIPVLLLLALATAVLLPASPARGQGTSNTLPDPIGGQDLAAYALRLELSDQQRLAIDRFHDQYLVDFETLRDGAIETFLEESGNLMRTFMFAPDSKRVKSAINDLNRLMSRIKALDDALFDQMLSVLSEEQAGAMPRVRQMRERARYRSGLVRFIGFANAGAQVDLGVILDEIDLAPGDRTAVDPLAAHYEMQLTADLRELYQETQRMFLALVEEVEAMNAARNQPGPGARRGGMFRSIRDMWAELGKGVMSDAASISTLNRRTNRIFGEALSEQAADSLTEAYYEKAYPDVARGIARVLPRYDAALRLDGLGAEKRSMIEVGRDGLRGRHDRLAEQMIDLTEEIRKAGAIMRFGSGERLPAEEKLDGLQKKRDDVNEQALGALIAMLGPVLAEDLEHALSDGGEDETAAQVVIASPRGSGYASYNAATPRAAGGGEGTGGADAPDPFLPGPIGTAFLRRTGDRLDLEEEQEAILESLHFDYLDDYETLRTERIQPILDAAGSMWAMDPESGGIKPPAAASIDELFTMRRETMAAILARDEAFFADIELAVLAEDDETRRARMPGVRLARQREVYRHDRSGAGGGSVTIRMGSSFRGLAGGGSREAAIDLVKLVEAQHLGSDEMPAARRVLDGYEPPFVDLLEQRYGLLLAADQESQKASAAAAAEGGRRGRGGNRFFAGGSGGSGEAVRAVDQAILELNRDTREALAGALSSSPGASLRRSYRRAAHPEVYDDPQSVEPKFLAALALDDVSEAQREQINDVFADYRGPYAQLCEQMTELAAANNTSERGGWRNVDWQKRQERRNQMERLRFSRSELNDKALRRLRAILTEAQVERIGLAAPTDR